MAAKRKSVPVRVSVVAGLFHRVVAILDQARSRVVRSVNSEMIIAYWHIGREIVQHEQRGRRRADYGAAVIAWLAARLGKEFGRGFDERNLWYMRKFYLPFPLHHELQDELESGGKLNALRSESSNATIVAAARPGNRVGR